MVKQAQNPWFEPVAMRLTAAEAENLVHANQQTAHTTQPPRPQPEVADVTHVSKGVEAVNEAQLAHAVNGR